MIIIIIIVKPKILWVRNSLRFGLASHLGAEGSDEQRHLRLPILVEKLPCAHDGKHTNRLHITLAQE